MILSQTHYTKNIAKTNIFTTQHGTEGYSFTLQYHTLMIIKVYLTLCYIKLYMHTQNVLSPLNSLVYNALLENGDKQLKPISRFDHLGAYSN